MDNTTAIAYVSHMGGKTMQCNKLAREMWTWSMSRHIWLSAAHIPGCDNTTADAESRQNHENTEWKLDPKIFNKITHIWGTPDIDLFASRLNTQLPKYISWKPDPFAAAVDAFSITWHAKDLMYIFPPFVLIGKILQKILQDESEAILIAPYWSTQAWFPQLTRCLIDCVFILPREKTTLSHPHLSTTSLPKTRLMACRLSGNRSRILDFQRTLNTFLCHHGEKGQHANIRHTSLSGYDFVVKTKRLCCHPLWEM